MAIRIQVTEADLKQGRDGTSTHCPVALAVKRRFGPHALVVVCPRGIYLNGKRFDISLSALRFINRWDDGKEVKPFGFDFDITQ